ncbi:MAG: Fe-S protein [Rickettsiales bacterium]|nr:Fe-S protein [Rickettsiales bacterium]
MLFTGTKSRPSHLGPYPLERLQRDPSMRVREETRGPAKMPLPTPSLETNSLGMAARKYTDLYMAFRDGPIAAQHAPVPEDLARRAADIKGFVYFLDAAHVGITKMSEMAWIADTPHPAHDHAIAVLVEHGRLPEANNPARTWCEDAGSLPGDLRAAEIGAGLASYIRLLGWSARAHVLSATEVDLERVAVLAGVAIRKETTGQIASPFLDHVFSITVVTTDYSLATDIPLKTSTKNVRGLGYWLGAGGAISGLEWRRRAKRPTHMSRYPMEWVKRVEKPTTLILEDEVPRLPKRAAFFERARFGDLGAKAKREITRFAYKAPTSRCVRELINALVPHQDGPVANIDTSELQDPEANARALKSLSYALGADLTGICEIPKYAWYSHQSDGTPIPKKHKYAVVMLIDQGYDTMEGASGDDWISGLQSMRGYLRGAEIAGVMAEHLRDLGFPARPQTNRDSDLLHIPLILHAGLGELSRIGELVLNPFVGPRFKSVVLTTDMPLKVDKPIDFGLQTFCENCFKCARECPCDAISLGSKVMFNGYEMWKPDVERCARYRVTNMKGSACGRCMKTCPLNKVVMLDGPLYAQIGTWLGIKAMWLKPILVPIATWLDDKLGNGRLNTIKKWWLDLEVIDDITVEPQVGTNRRDLAPNANIDPSRQKIAYYPAAAMPPPETFETPYPVDRKAALAEASRMETPLEALARKATEIPS